MFNDMSESHTDNQKSVAEEVVSTEVKVCQGDKQLPESCDDDTCPISLTEPCSTKAIRLAEELYRHVTMGADSYLHTLPHVEEAGDPLKTDITAALCYYEKLAGKVADRLSAMGGQPAEEGKMTKAMAHAGISMNAMKDRSRSHIAEMLIEGCTMSVTAAYRLERELTEAARNCDGGGGKQDAEELATLCLGWAEFEETHIERLKAHI